MQCRIQRILLQRSSGIVGMLWCVGVWSAVQMAAVADEPAFVVAGYLPDYRLNDWTADRAHLTDLICFGMSAPEDGRFPDGTFSEEQLAHLKQLKTTLKCRLLFTVGGWNNSQGFAKLAASDVLRHQFIINARSFCRQHGFDGIDYDWEHPEGPDQLTQYGLLIQETHNEFGPHHLMVTAAMAGWQLLDSRTYAAIDRIHLMSYDHDFPQATMQKSRDDVSRLVTAGCARSKISLGLPFYGRNASGDARTYAELCADGADGSDLHNGFALNGPQTIAEKVRFARQEKLAGVMIWEVAQDADGHFSLLNIINNARTGH
ncbi:MAG: glycoside hydrolase family 18 protein [Planctomycetaceae bacterium]